MGIKNQKTLFISGFAIIGTTVLGIVALNFAVEKISNIQPVLAMALPPQAPKQKALGIDDAMELNQPPQKRRPDKRPDLQFRPLDQKQRMPPQAPPPPQGAMRRMRNGQQPSDIQRTDAPPPENRAPSMPNNYPPMYPPPQQYLSPEEQRRMEEEMERMQDYYPEPGPYYPPPEDYYEDYYPGYEDYYYGPEGKIENLEKDPRITKDLNPEDLVPEFYPEPDREMIDDYLNEFYEE